MPKYDLFDFKGAAEQMLKEAFEENKNKWEQELKTKVMQELVGVSKVHEPLVGITIVFKNEHMITYKEEEYTDYTYDGKVFVVIRDKQWIGVFNIKSVEYITVGK